MVEIPSPIAIVSFFFTIIGAFVTLREFYEYFLEKKFRNLLFWIKGIKIKVVITKTITYNRRYSSSDFKKIIDLLSPKTSSFNYRSFTSYQNYATLSFVGTPTMIKIEYLPESSTKSKIVIQTLTDIPISFRSFGNLEEVSSKLDSLFSTIQRVNYDLFETQIITNLEVDVKERDDKTYEFELERYNVNVKVKGNRFMVFSSGVSNLSEVIKSTISQWNSIR